MGLRVCYVNYVFIFNMCGHLGLKGGHAMDFALFSPSLSHGGLILAV